MTPETRNNVGNEDVKEHENAPLTEQPRGWGLAGKKSTHVLLGVVLFGTLSLIILSVDDESESVVQAPESAEATTIALSEPPAPPQEFSPQVLEDFRTAPTDDLEIQPEPILTPPLVEQSAEISEPEEPAMPEDTQDPGIDDFSLGQALARYLIAMRDDLNREYVENCIQHRSRNGLGAECPENPAFRENTNQKEKALVDELFAIITRQSDYARISRQLERENEALAAILADPTSPTRTQASTRLALNNSYLDYLNGNPNPDVVTFERMNSFINDYNRTINSGPVQFRCKDGPCIYEYTGPEAE